MPSDIIKTKDKLAIQLAKQLGFSGMFLVDNDVIIIKTGNKSEVGKLIQKARKKFSLVCVQGSQDEINREAVEAKADVLLSPEFSREKERDFMEYKNSGLGTVLCKLASKNHVAVGINFSDILQAEGNYREILLGRISQNTKLCRKYKVGMLLASFAQSPLEMRSFFDLRALAEQLGMTPLEAKNSLSLAENIIKQNLESI